MASLDALGNIDIWMDVLQYFHISLQTDPEAEIKNKRKALLRVALLSPSLTMPALDILWEAMTSLEPIVNVINSGATSPDDQVLVFQNDRYGGYWSLREPVTSEEKRDRIYDYLSRIRYLKIAVGATREMGLWSTLSMSLGIGTSSMSLLPKLGSLSLSFDQAGNSVGTWIYSMHPLLSPTLKTVSYYDSSSVHAAGIDTLHAMLRSQSLALEHITYQGYPSSSFLQTCLAFDGLKMLRLICDPGRPSVPRYTSGVTITKVFEELRNLRDVKIDLRVFPLQDEGDSLLLELMLPPFLRTLSLVGDASDIGRFLMDSTKTTSVHSLSVAIFHPGGLVWRVFCDKIASNFPHLHTLSFRRAGSTGLHQVLMQDLSSLLSRSTMQSLRINGIPHCLTEANMGGLLDAWPMLHTIAITNDHTIYFSASLLVRLSQANHLRHIQLPLELTPLVQGALPDDSVPVSRSLVQELTVTHVSSFPSSLEGKIELAKNLFMLFPKLERIFTHDSSHQQSLGELEKVIESFRSMIVTYLRRRDIEKRRNHVVVAKVDAGGSTG